MASLSLSPLRPLICGVGAPFGAIISTSIGQPALAQDKAQPDGPAPDGVVQLDTVVLMSDGEAANTNAASTGIARLPATVRETPQVVDVVPAEIIKQQDATSLEEVLRNVPGITLSTGEGRGGSLGDQFRIRGLAGQGDVYQDGLRDFGAYNHDTFDTESVQVLKGPSGEAFGVGNLGGLINQQRKKAGLENFDEVQGSFGTGPVRRLQYDANRAIDDTRAIRFNVMVQDGDVPGRDRVKDDRAGIAVDFGTGIGTGTGTEWHLGYSWLRLRGRPDQGQPIAEGSDGVWRPLLDFGVRGYDRDISYVRRSDRDDVDGHAVTSSLVHQMDNGWTLSNDTRIARYRRNFSATTPTSCDNACLEDLFTGVDAPLAYGAGGVIYDQDDWGFQSVLTVKGEATTGSIRHEITAGLDPQWQTDHRRRGSWVVPRLAESTILNPVFEDGPVVFDWDLDHSTAKATDVGLFVSDRVHFSPQFSVLASLRADHFKSSFDGRLIASSVESHGESSASRVSPALSLIWEPTANAMAYLSFARTWRPLGTDIASAVNSFDTEVPASDRDLRPERSDLIEIGGKMDLLDGRLGLTAAAFQIDKKNSFDIDPSTGDIVVGFTEAGQARRIHGVELGASGEVAEGTASSSPIPTSTAR